MASAIGGVLVGAGFAIGGYCPGTSVAGLASGRVDALVFIVGLLVGTFAFVGLYGPTVRSVMAMGMIAEGDTFTDAFGVVAMVAMTPLITVQLMGLVAQLKTRKARSAQPLLDTAALLAELPDDAIIEL